MMPPSDFMLYATPVILLISQEVRAYLAKRDLKRITEKQTSEIKDVTEGQTTVLQSTTLDAATKVAIHTSDQATALAKELDTIHDIVNGNTTALMNRIAELERQLAQKNKP